MIPGQINPQKIISVSTKAIKITTIIISTKIIASIITIIITEGTSKVKEVGSGDGM